MAANTPLYVVLGASGVVGMFCCRELLQKGGNVRAVMKDPEKNQGELEDMITYFPRGKRGRLQVVKGDVTKAEDMRRVMEGSTVVIFAATGNNFSGPGSSYDVDNLGVGVAAEAAKVSGVQKFVLCSCAVVTEKHTFTLTRFWMNINKWRFMDNKLAGERLLRKSGMPYSICRFGSLYLSNDGTGGQYKLRVGQGDVIKGVISRADAAAVACACAIDPALALNATFEVCQNEFLEEYTERDEAGSRWQVFQYLKPDDDAGSVSISTEADPPRAGADGAQPAAGPSSSSEQQQPQQQQQGWFGLPNPLPMQLPALFGEQEKPKQHRVCRWLDAGKPSWQPKWGADNKAAESAEPEKRASDRGGAPAPPPPPAAPPPPEAEGMVEEAGTPRHRGSRAGAAASGLGDAAAGAAAKEKSGGAGGGQHHAEQPGGAAAADSSP